MLECWNYEDRDQKAEVDPQITQITRIRKKGTEGGGRRSEDRGQSC